MCAQTEKKPHTAIYLLFRANHSLHFTRRAVNFIIFDVWFTISNENEIDMKTRTHTHARTRIYTSSHRHPQPGCDEYKLLIAEEIDSE